MPAPSDFTLDYAQLAMHVQSARRSALRIYSYAGSIIPDAWKDVYINNAIGDIFEFAVHARIINDLCGWSELERDIDFNVYQPDQGGPVVRNYQHALNRIIHARQLVAGLTFVPHRPVFANASKNIAFTHVEVRSNNFPLERISLTGISVCFLSDVIIALKKEHPKFAF